MVSAIALTVPLAFEPKSAQVMQQPPRNPFESLLSGSLSWRILIISLWNAIITFSAFEWVLKTTSDLDLARTVAVNVLVATEIFYLLCISQFIPSVVFRMLHQRNVKQTANAPLQGSREPIGYAPIIGIVCLTVLQILFSQWSVMNELFDTAPLNLTMWLFCLAVGLSIVVVALPLRRFTKE